jgi:hypothetical protein
MKPSEIAKVLEKIIPEGKAHALKGDEIYLALCADYSYEYDGDGPLPALPNYREFREIIAEHLPWTCSCSKGYFFAATTQERREAVAYLESYIKALARRRREIIKKYSNDFCGVQLNLWV